MNFPNVIKLTANFHIMKQLNLYCGISSKIETYKKLVFSDFHTVFYLMLITTWHMTNAIKKCNIL